MKKILLILLAFSSFASFAQAEFPEGIALSGNAASVSTSKIVTQEPTTGNLNYIDALDLPASTADKLKSYLSTGLIKNGLIAVNGDPTKFNITAGVGIISNFDDPIDPVNPVSTIINFPAFIGITPAYLTTGNITYVAIDSTPAVVMQATAFTPEQRRSLIILGAVIHSNLTTINVLNNISAPSNASTNQLHDFMEAVGALNLTGNKYTENGANLQLNKSAGVLFKLGSNFAVDWRNPHQIAQAGGTAITFRYRTQNGTESADMTSISPGLYDLNNVLTTVPNNKFTIQTVTVFQTGLTRIQWGQTLYDDLQSAKNALLTRNFVVENNIRENGVTRAYIIVRNSATSLQNIADAYISEAQKFGGVASGGVALTLANIVSALGYTPENEANKQNSLAVDGTGVKYPTVDATNAGLALKQNTITNPITGTGTVNYIPKFTGTTTQGNSILTQTSSTQIDIAGSLVLPATVEGIKFGGNTSSFPGIFKLAGASPVLTALLANGSDWAEFGAQRMNTVTGYRTGLVGIFGFTSSGGNPSSGGTVDTGISRFGSGRFAFGNGTASNITGQVIADKFLARTSVDDGINVGIFNGSVTFSAGTLPNQGVTKSQLDLKADIASPTFTGVPSVPTASAGTNTTQIASTAFVNNNFLTKASPIFTGDIFGSGSYVTEGSFKLGSTNTGLERYGSSAASFKEISNVWTSNVSLKATTLNTNSYTVSSLPTGVQGATAYVTDALAPTYLSIVVGGGAVVTPVFYDGTVWRSIINSDDVVKNIAKDATQGANVTGTVSETILYSKLIPANTFKDGDFMNIVLSRIGKTGTAGTLNQRIRINTSNTLSLSTIIATNFLVSTGLMGNMSRIFNVSNGNIVSVLNNGAFTSDIVNTNTEPKSTLFNPAIDNYIFVTGQLSNSADTMYHLGTKITN